MLINMTPHAVNIIAEDGAVTVPPSGVVPRVTWDRRGCGTMAVEGIEVPVTAYSGDPHVDPPLPDEQEGVLLLVARVVAEAVPGRGDLVVPDGLVRDEAGRVVGCRALGRVGRA